MPDYRFDLHEPSGGVARRETVSAADDQEAKSLAEMRLLLSRDFTKIDVFLREQRKFALARDSAAMGRTGR